MPLTQRIHDQFQASIQTLRDALELLAEPIGQAAETMLDSLMHEGKILVCGNGASARLGRHLTASLADRYERDRPGLAAISLRADSAAMTDDANLTQGFARQIAALGHANDVLLVISTFGGASNILEAVQAAHERDMRVVALSGGDGGPLAEALTESDVLICAPSSIPARIHETHMLAIHCLCDGIDYFLLGA